MTVGLLGGAFDPPHNGHVALAHAALERFGLDPLVVLVAANPGHRSVEAPAEARLRLVQAAFGDLHGVVVELDDHPRTIDLLREGRWDDPLFVLGADEFAAFPSWKEPDEVLALAQLGVATRPGYPRDRLRRVLLQLRHPERVHLFEISPVAVSSTEVRRRAARGEPLDGLVPPAVAALVRELGVYHG
ncbi:MAG: nicotinate-nicotinamide nucleotide adenylyltransferase [Actinomycetota bacterium]|nr:nicotinate-nicotinamide nucleotide adenylyltransferase [Actinomycetota bacterium]